MTDPDIDEPWLKQSPPAPLVSDHAATVLAVASAVVAVVGLLALAFWLRPDVIPMVLGGVGYGIRACAVALACAVAVVVLLHIAGGITL